MLLDRNKSDTIANSVKRPFVTLPDNIVIKVKNSMLENKLRDLKIKHETLYTLHNAGDFDHYQYLWRLLGIYMV